VDVLVYKTMEAAVQYRAGTVLLAGGVAANRRLRSAVSAAAADYGLRVVYPPPLLCTDNAAMIACAAYYRYLRGDFADLTLNAVPDLEIEWKDFYA